MPFVSSYQTREQYNAYYREYRAKNRDRMRAYQRKYNKQWRRKHGFYNEEIWKRKNRIKVNAEKMVQRAIKVGKMKRLPCVVCGSENSVAHHHDYKKPLYVTFLCKVHHYEIHHRR